MYGSTHLSFDDHKRVHFLSLSFFCLLGYRINHVLFWWLGPCTYHPWIWIEFGYLDGKLGCSVWVLMVQFVQTQLRWSWQYLLLNLLDMCMCNLKSIVWWCCLTDCHFVCQLWWAWDVVFICMNWVGKYWHCAVQLWSLWEICCCIGMVGVVKFLYHSFGMVCTWGLCVSRVMRDFSMVTYIEHN